MTRVAITGARGFIGRRLACAHLERGDYVRILTRSPGGSGLAGCEAVVGDLAVPGAIPAEFLEGIDVVYHCAAELRDEAVMEAVNIEGTRHLLELASGRIRRWVQLSSVGVYGPRRAGEVRENAAINPVNAYERTKATADRLVIDAATRGDFEWTMLRPSIVYGPDMPNSSLRQLAAMVKRHLFFFIGAPGACANYVHVDNVVSALVLCGLHPRAAGEVFNLSDCQTFEEFVGAIATSLAVPIPTWRLPEWLVRTLASGLSWLPGNPLTAARIDAMTGRAIYPSDRITTVLGYERVISMQDGIAQTLDRGARPAQ